MSKEVRRHDQLVSDRLHPFVYMAMLGLVLWLVLSVWDFAYDGYVDYLLAVVSGFMLMVVAILSVLSRVWWKNHRPDATRDNSNSFRDWAAGEFETWPGPLKGANAAVEILLPIAALALGMTAFGIVLHFTAHGAM